MLPKWFDDWSEKNPIDIYRPAILLGTVGGVVFVVALLVTWGQPLATESLQTGPRGTGMSVPEFKADLAKPDPSIIDYYTEAAYDPADSGELARDVYENVQVLGDVTEDNFNRLMNAMTQWVSPDEGCAYCHAGADEGNYADDDLYTKVVSRRMIQMTQGINENWDAHVNANKEVGVNCYTCHRGQNVPSDIWFRISPVNENVEGWAANQNRATMVSQSTSLPSDALEQYLLNYEQIAVHDLDSRVDTQPGDPTIQNTERTYSLMNYFSNSLGVNCVFCHNSRAFYDGAQNTPQWATASLGIVMVQELNNDYLVPLRDVYPPERLGPIFSDAPKAACATCHKGYQQPLQGQNMIADWPELATTGTPEY
ncbi:photosynthetic reaction center cytochrome PufC [Parasulfitobacter algicola]|uniref:Photosynthetic reaction center cytochrome c subunit n=1 Tax=Parasulfitobacter algicola TaxID=2614809 RepID=A0ABX2ISM4_9RHOB|nr:photosynthetic reaction center cytochrome PufC [Sulfitobacter algicola]NSX53218.1 photosynthetic reaction center cytochrome c subunit [Sulfitobacter algicola]